MCVDPDPDPESPTPTQTQFKFLTRQYISQLLWAKHHQLAFDPARPNLIHSIVKQPKQ